MGIVKYLVVHLFVTQGIRDLCIEGCSVMIVLSLAFPPAWGTMKIPL